MGKEVKNKILAAFEMRPEKGSYKREGNFVNAVRDWRFNLASFKGEIFYEGRQSTGNPLTDYALLNSCSRSEFQSMYRKLLAIQGKVNASMGQEILVMEAEEGVGGHGDRTLRTPDFDTYSLAIIRETGIRMDLGVGISDSSIFIVTRGHAVFTSNLYEVLSGSKLRFDRGNLSLPIPNTAEETSILVGSAKIESWKIQNPEIYHDLSSKLHQGLARRGSRSQSQVLEVCPGV